MKYSKIYKDKQGGLFVMSGKTKFFPDTETNNESEALVLCDLKSIGYHLKQIDSIIKQLGNDVENINVLTDVLQKHSGRQIAELYWLSSDLFENFYVKLNPDEYGSDDINKTCHGDMCC